MSRLYNLLGAVPLIAWYLWSLWRGIPLLLERSAALGTGGRVDAMLAFQTLAQVASLAFISLIIPLLVVRDVPRAQTRGLAPYGATLVGAFAVFSFLLLPGTTLSVPLLIVATSCIIIGFVLSISTLIYLGRSFSVLPSARILVTDGPYRFIRHPLYLFEEIFVVGMMLQYNLLWSVPIAMAHLAAQFMRMQYEEEVLAKAFPAYTAYAARTARLIPGVY